MISAARAMVAAFALISASPSFASSVTGTRPARRNASPPGNTTPPNSASPSPISGNATCESCGRSATPIEPMRGTTGTTWALRSATSASNTCGDTPDPPAAMPAMRANIIARTEARS